ncbi:MAG: glycosyltransferase family 4 protein [Pseudomonadota bacterium]|nr:glycosyltransferase family 4 protein [Pseudomonadota bacterium]
MRVGLLTVHVPFVRGGAEMLAESLAQQLRRAGHEAEIISLPFKWYPGSRIPEHMLACRLVDVEESCGVPIDRVIGLKFPAYLIRHSNKVMWILHQHRTAYELWGTELGDLHRMPDGAHIRSTIMTADTGLIPEARACYTISQNVSDRLRQFCGIASRPLYHPPPGAELLAVKEYGDFFLVPSRINRTKRQDLVVKALSEARHPVRVVFMGLADDRPYHAELRRLAEDGGLGDRVVWAGTVSEHERVDLYAKCLGVIFPPFDEDYGYVTLEAMLSCKPVVTCTDSGGPLEFVADRVNGLVCEPHPTALAEALDLLWTQRHLAREYGRAGRQRYAEMRIGWEETLACLIA